MSYFPDNEGVLVVVFEEKKFFPQRKNENRESKRTAESIFA